MFMRAAAFFLGRAGTRMVAGACAAAVLGWSVSAQAMGKRAATPSQPEPEAGQGQPAGAQKVVAPAEDFRYDAHGKRDPFFPLVTPDGRLTAPTASAKKAVVMLEGIIWDPGGNSAAMINGVVVKPGDEVEGYRVVTIIKDGVVLEREGKLIKVRLAIGELDEQGGEPVESTP